MSNPLPPATSAPNNLSSLMNSSPLVQVQFSGGSGGGAGGAGHGGQASKALDAMRAYRACLHCRNRKSKCDLDPNQGRPPCRRCQRENRECVLGESHRGGRRVRKKAKTEDGSVEGEEPLSSSSSSFAPPGAGASFQSPITEPVQYGPGSGSGPLQPHPGANPIQYNRPVWQPPPADGGETSTASHSQYPPIPSPSTIQPPYRSRLESTTSLVGKAHEGIASADLQNPSDALEILAQVADRAEDSNSPRSDDPSGQAKRRQPVPRPDPPQPMIDTWHYRPIQEGLLSPEMVYQLFQSYEQFFHPFFPIIPTETFDRSRFQWLSRYEPHLFSAILTVASKDDERIHQVCYDHMQLLISNILAGADADVEAVESLLLLSQWVSHRPQVAATVGRGEEDRVAWMYIGTALRLGYFLEIDRTSFNSDNQEDPVIFHRKRLVWAACYICDRQVSVRVGKGFWARGPGPLSGLRASDFPTLRPTSEHYLDYGSLFQANLELTQIFSNVHDILYSSKGHAWKEMLEGRYAKYLDDFRFSIRKWDDTWGNIHCPVYIKASLQLNFDYLRLYVNAFAYQATISRALTDQRDSQHNPHRAVPLIDATAPDARFIYEAIDAATSLLSRFNNDVDPQTLRHMPSSYYLFIIYSAVFLYKARSTTSMKEDEREAVRMTIKATITRLQASSVGANQMGTRYARLLELLWRKSPKRSGPGALHKQSLDNRLAHSSLLPAAQKFETDNFDPSLHSASYHHHLNNNPATQNEVDQQQQQQQQYLEPGQYSDTTTMGGMDNSSGSGATFSWLDLNSTFNFALQNGTGGGGSTSGGEEGGGGGGSGGGALGPGEDGMGGGFGQGGGFMDTSFLGVPDGTQFQF
ncbi:uncharacterized protein L3040_001199 [Drepanopeziza brunnea f. sp. 'multigermtubi']|uniref:uncharacterized protein n=1 Tax=Drepanopeziza brunnea f. sp. 'multigermtubi' TaxID=698441 RepID=UPI0023A70213|nr:hypothetical protein L3040_001199 [Drepanopeziza brunnea f. sp. 'multigermtubi']